MMNLDGRVSDNLDGHVKRYPDGRVSDTRMDV